MPAPAPGRVLTLLFLVNLLNFFDRAMPAVVIEEVRIDFALSDTQIGAVAAALTVVYAVAGVPLGRLADRRSRKNIMAAGLTAWSVLTAATGAVGSFAGLLVVRVGVGIGEASYAPAANSLIGDLYPAGRRSRAVAIFMLGLPLGLMLAYFTVGAVTEVFDSWRAPFFIAAVPGLVLAVALYRVREPRRGAAEEAGVAPEPVERPLRRIASVPTVRRLVLAFLAYNVAAITVNAFSVPLMQRYFGLSLVAGATVTGLVVGLTGLVGLTLGGRLGDRASQHSAAHRVRLGAACLAAAAPLTLLGLSTGDGAVVAFAVVFGLGWLLGYVFYTCCYPALSDVVEPRLRGSAIALLFVVGYLLGGAAGPLVVGGLSDSIAEQARIDAGAATLTREFKGIGLHDAMQIVVPISLGVAAAAMLLASRTAERDRTRMLARLTAAAR